MLLKLAVTFSLLSMLAVGGGTALLHEMQRLMFLDYGILPAQFLKAYSVGQLAPGPNMTMVVVLGERIAGIAGALVAGFAFFVPSSVLCFWVGRFWNRIGETPWRRAVQSALEPISIGLMCSGIYAIGKTALTGPATLGVALLAFLLLMLTRITPVAVILGLGAAGAALLHLVAA